MKKKKKAPTSIKFLCLPLSKSSKFKPSSVLQGRGARKLASKYWLDDAPISSIINMAGIDLPHILPQNHPQSNQESQQQLQRPTRRPRGRPRGSKNKPKPPTIITRDAPNSLRSTLLHVSSDTDLLHSLSDLALRRGRAISILHAHGSLSSLSLKHATINGGRFEIVSITGTVLPPPAPPVVGGLTVFISGGKGRVVGGRVVGPVITAGVVVVVVAAFANAVYERLPAEGEEDVRVDHQSVADYDQMISRDDGYGRENGGGGGVRASS